MATIIAAPDPVEGCEQALARWSSGMSQAEILPELFTGHFDDGAAHCQAGVVRCPTECVVNEGLKSAE
ncbi:hypothetical protein ACWTU6_13145 [Mesorhizobium sp. BHbsci]